MARLVWGIALLLCLVACGDPHDVVVPGNLANLEENAELKDAAAKLTDSERASLLRYMMRSALGAAFAAKVPDRTIREALANQSQFEAEKAAKEAAEKAEQARQEELARQVRAEQEALRAKMAGILTFALVSKRFQEADYMRGIQDGIVCEFAFENRGDKDISGAKGRVVFANMFGDRITSITVAIEQPIPAGGRIEWSGAIDYNQFDAEDRALRDADPSKMKTTWEPSVYLFADGSSIGEKT